ncbi:MAG TPA: hypothetical protein VGK67_10530 [Myxococcales bacterium]
MSARPAALLALALCLASCKPGRTALEFCKARFDALEERDVRCGASKEVAAAGWDPFEAYLCANVPALERDRKIAYDPNLAEACLKRLADLPCGAVEPLEDDPCDTAITGKQVAGSACYTGVECAPGTLCAASNCPGSCVQRAPVGFECGGLVRCEEGAFCLSGACVASVQEGGSCRVGSIDCDQGLYCAGEKPIQSSPPGSCRKLGSVSTGPCDQPIACAFGKVCAGQDSAANTAGACEAPVADGKACSASSSCGPESFCRDGQCAARPRLGDACGLVGGGTASCLLGWCRMEAGAGKCADFLLGGDACDTSDACGPVARCQGGKCVAFCQAPLED